LGRDVGKSPLLHVRESPGDALLEMEEDV